MKDSEDNSFLSPTRPLIFVSLNNINMSHITAEELFDRVYGILTAAKCTAANRMMHDTLVLACHAGVKDTEQAFGNLFSQVDFLCKRCRVSASDKYAIQNMRRHSNRNTAL